MCGIFGYIAENKVDIKYSELQALFKKLALLSESRGKESSGLAVMNQEEKKIQMLKADIPATELINNRYFSEFFRLAVLNQQNSHAGNIGAHAVIGHSRLVTKGKEEEENNNQPVIKDGIVGIHNGIIVNDELLWQKHPEMKREFEVDTESIIALIRMFLNRNLSISSAVKHAFSEIYGTASLALMFNDIEKVLLASNNGSLYLLTFESTGIVIFASEKYILTRIEEYFNFSKKFGDFKIRQVRANEAYLIQLGNNALSHFEINNLTLDSSEKENIISPPYQIISHSGKIIHKTVKSPIKTLVAPLAAFNVNEEKLLTFEIDKINLVKRCKICLLPANFPYIKFDENGVCNVCNNYKPKSQALNVQDLDEILQVYRKKNREADCIIPYSGGRDSTFLLHYLKKEMGLNPIAFTYDWGMVTDLARRNIARVCGKLGVENVIVSANIRQKRENIRKNIIAWLKKPQLGMIPLFMAGDKQFFYYAHELQKQTKINLNIWGVNKLENTDFKVGFCGVDMRFNKEHIFSLDKRQKFQLFKFIFKSVLTNPAYLNSSIYDTISSFYSRYFIPKKHYFQFYDFKKWNETEILNTIVNEYEWELASDTASSWRIGDGTAPFYNYIYYTVAGFTEIDTFRSNQIREGMISREEAMRLVSIENAPRYEGIKWYLDIIGLDFEDTIKTINNIPKLYEH